MKLFICKIISQLSRQCISEVKQMGTPPGLPTYSLGRQAT